MKNNGMPIGAPLVIDGPFIFEKAKLHLIVCKGNPAYIKSLLPEQLKASPMRNRIILGCADYPLAYAESAPDVKYTYNETVIFTPVRKTGTLFNFGLYVPYIYASNDRAIAAGREIYGFPKKLGETEIVDIPDKPFSISLFRQNIRLIDIKSNNLRRSSLSNFFNCIIKVVPTKLINILFPKVFTYKYIPDVDGRAAQSSIITTKFKINKIHQFEWPKKDTISIKFIGSKEDPLHQFAPLAIKPICALSLVLDMTLPHEEKSR